ncbi:MAG: AraC family transcriptional regulator [Pelagimonas sp.]|jgi:AraC-like DNA-binding protein|nr:AraC family transcriptional regulator [Pelagimonas sp.]
MADSNPTNLSTVSAAFIQDWLEGIMRCANREQMDQILHQTGLNASGQRVTLDQIVLLYQIAAPKTQDEMTGLWSRQIRPRALQHLLSTVRDATSLSSVLYRYSTYWNLLLDDYQFQLTQTGHILTLSLHEQGPQTPQRFGHLLILKLAHGLLSWLAGHEVPVEAVQFAFARPAFAADYAVIFPARASFDAPHSALSFDVDRLGPTQARSAAEMDEFLLRAPRDWMFTNLREHTQSLQIREFLYQSDWSDCQLVEAAAWANITPRTLMRRLDAEGTSFQAIKDALRRDLAIRDLQAGRKSIEEISQDVGFSSAANFHKAFRRWTGTAPGAYRVRLDQTRSPD